MTSSSEKIRITEEFETPVATEAEAQPQKFVREIEVGGRKQKFESDTYEGLVDKLVEAQENATKKLQELATQRRGRIEPEKKSSDYQPLQSMQLKAEELQQLQADPHELVRRIFQAEAGMSLEEFRMREGERRRMEAEYRAQSEFVQRHPDYVPTNENAQKLFKFLQEQGYPVSKANLDYAFEELRGELSQTSQPAAPAPVVQSQGRPAPPPSSAPPSFVRPSLGGRAPTGDESGGIDVNAEAARIAQLSPAEAKARIEQLWRQSRSAR
jgi:hypothetical protein